MQETHDRYMAHALRLAAKGSGFVNPNPMVGAVLVKNEIIIGEGYHTAYGKSHAEIEALKNVSEDTEGATIYVTLEPCSHHGKTPPCAEALVKAKVAKVVIAMLDPNPLVRGRGVKMLKEAGIEVFVGVQEKAAHELNRIFVKYITTQMPYVLLKTAMTLDGKIATQTGDSRWVSSRTSREKVHELRHRLMGIMVGVNTVLQDNPHLDCRLQSSVRQPVKIIVDSLLCTPLDAKLWEGDATVIIGTTIQPTEELKQKYREKGAEIIEAGAQRVNLTLLMQRLGARGIDCILLEGGATLNASALQENLVDEVWTFVAPKIIGGALAPTSVGGQGALLMKDAFSFKEMTAEPSGEDWLLKARIK